MTAAPAHSLEARYCTDPQLHAREFGGSGVVFPHRLPFAGKAVREISGAVCRNRHSPSVKSRRMAACHHACKFVPVAVARNGSR